MIKRITLTEDHIKLISLLKFDEDEKNNFLVIDKYDPYMLSGRLEDIALALGVFDKMIPGTENDADGGAFPDDVEKYLLDTHHYVVDNLKDIESLIHQFVFKGGLSAGTYKCIDNEMIWAYEVL